MLTQNSRNQTKSDFAAKLDVSEPIAPFKFALVTKLDRSNLAFTFPL